jgi:hypothetical protein
MGRRPLRDMRGKLLRGKFLVTPEFRRGHHLLRMLLGERTAVAIECGFCFGASIESVSDRIQGSLMRQAAIRCVPNRVDVAEG